MQPVSRIRSNSPSFDNLRAALAEVDIGRGALNAHLIAGKRRILLLHTLNAAAEGADLGRSGQGACFAFVIFCQQFCRWIVGTDLDQRLLEVVVGSGLVDFQVASTVLIRWSIWRGCTSSDLVAGDWGRHPLPGSLDPACPASAVSSVSINKCFPIILNKHKNNSDLIFMSVVTLHVLLAQSVGDLERVSKKI